MRTKPTPKPLSPTGKGVRLETPPEVGETFYGITGRGSEKSVDFFTVIEVAPYIRKSDGEQSYLILFRDQDQNFWTSGMSTARMQKRGKRRPSLTDPFDTALARPLGNLRMGVSLEYPPNVGDLFWTFPNNDNSQKKIYVKVAELRPFRTNDGKHDYRIKYKDQDGNEYSSCLTSYKLVNLSKPDNWETKVAEYKRKKQNA